MRPPILRLYSDELFIDMFAGGGGASTGCSWAIGRDPDVAANHDAEALAMYKANHPNTRVLCADVFDVNPRLVCGGRRVAGAWFSPDCTFFSKARGGVPHRDRDPARRRRGLAGVVLKWAEQVRPRYLFVENVPEFQEWGPLIRVGDEWMPDPARTGQSFRRWCARLRNLGYTVEWRELRACDYGAPTSRKRLFIIASLEPIVWPQPTHGRGRLPYRTAAECIDWSIPCPSIFTRKRPLAEATLRRIARGIRRYVLEAAQPFIVPVKTWGGGGNEPQSIDKPLRTVTTSKRGEYAVVSPTLINTRNGEREGQAPRVYNIQGPYPTITAVGSQGALVAAFLARHYGGHENDGAQLSMPLHTITTQDHHALVACHLKRDFGASIGGSLDEPLPTVTAGGGGHAALVASSLVKLKGTCRDGQPVTEPLGTVQAQGLHYAEVRAFLIAYYGEDQDPQLGLPLATVTTKHRFGLVTVHGVDYAIVDIGMRMLEPRELFNAQGFPADYVIDPMVGGKRLTKTAQVEKCGNSVSPYMSCALVRAQFGDREQHQAVA